MLGLGRLRRNLRTLPASGYDPLHRSTTCGFPAHLIRCTQVPCTHMCRKRASGSSDPTLCCSRASGVLDVFNPGQTPTYMPDTSFKTM